MDTLPEVAKRRGNADTLFSADWFDEDEGTPAPAAPTAAAPAASGGTAPAKPKPAAPVAAVQAPIVDSIPQHVPAAGGSPMLYVAILGLFIFLGCSGMGVGIGMVLLIR